MANTPQKKALTMQELLAQKQALVAQIEQADKEIAAGKEQEVERLSNLIDNLPAHFGIVLDAKSGSAAKDRETALSTIAGYIKARIKGTLGKLDTTVRTYTRMTEEHKAEIDKKLKEGVQISVLVTQYPYSQPAFYARKAKLGLTKKAAI